MITSLENFSLKTLIKLGKPSFLFYIMVMLNQPLIALSNSVLGTGKPTARGNYAYNLMMANSVNYSVVQGQRKDFNVNASQKIKVNTGSVTENYYDILTDLIMSERILVNGLPATIKTKGLSKLKGVNTKDSNYTLEFEYAYNTINNVI